MLIPGGYIHWLHPNVRKFFFPEISAFAPSSLSSHFVKLRWNAIGQDLGSLEFGEKIMVWVYIPNNPWDWYIYLHENHILPLKTTIHVGKYTVIYHTWIFWVWISHTCWWFRNPKEPAFECIWNLVKNGIFPTNLNWCRISEPSTAWVVKMGIVETPKVLKIVGAIKTYAGIIGVAWVAWVCQLGNRKKAQPGIFKLVNSVTQRMTKKTS